MTIITALSSVVGVDRTPQYIYISVRSRDIKTTATHRSAAVSIRAVAVAETPIISSPFSDDNDDKAGREVEDFFFSLKSTETFKNREQRSLKLANTSSSLLKPTSPTDSIRFDETKRSRCFMFVLFFFFSPKTACPVPDNGNEIRINSGNRNDSKINCNQR